MYCSPSISVRRFHSFVVENTPKFWKVLIKTRLLLVLMEERAGNAYLSFEGDLQGLSLLSMITSHSKMDDNPVWHELLVLSNTKMGVVCSRSDP